MWQDERKFEISIFKSGIPFLIFFLLKKDLEDTFFF